MWTTDELTAELRDDLRLVVDFVELLLPFILLDGTLEVNVELAQSVVDDHLVGLLMRRAVQFSRWGL